jgi:hypothetical protein
MRWTVLATLLLAPLASAQAQTSPATSPPTAVPAPSAPDAATAAPAAPPADAGQAPTPAPPLPNIWLPKPVAELTALDKVTARATRLTVRVGQSKTFGSLIIAVRSCAVRPPDQPADAAAFLDITDSHGGTPFHGWMLADEPGLALLQSPTYDVRPAACHE